MIKPTVKKTPSKFGPVALGLHGVGQVHALFHLAQGYDVVVPCYAHEEAFDDDQRQGNGEGDGHAPAGRGTQANLASEAFDVALDHVHAYAAAGEIGSLLGGGESRLEDHGHDPVRIGLVGAQQLFFDGADADILDI